MKQYLMAVHTDFSAEPTQGDDLQQAYEDVDAFNKELQDQGLWVFGGGLWGPETATVVRVQDDEIVTTDGPYIETKEVLGGFWVVKAPDLDAALALAAKASKACRESVEVRPFQDEPED